MELDHLTSGATIWVSGDCTESGKDANPSYEFGMFKYHEHPGDGWELVDSAHELNEHHAAFIQFYNTNKGIPAINHFTTVNSMSCCWTLRDGHRLLVNGKYALPSSQADEIGCRPAQGNPVYSGTFKFYTNFIHRTALPATTAFSEGPHCGGNYAFAPGLYYRIITA